MKRIYATIRKLAYLSLGLLAACGASPASRAKPATDPPLESAPALSVPVPAEPSLEQARAYVERFSESARALGREYAKASWVQQTYITEDTDFLAAKAGERWLNFRNQMLEEGKRFKDLPTDTETGRAISLILSGVTLPAPRDRALVARLAEISTQLESMYGSGKYCKADGSCRDLEALTSLMADSRDYDALLDAWTGWRTVSPPMRPLYSEFVTLMNQGARELGFDDTGALWKSGYDMPAAEFEAEAERLWQQVRPLYQALHCHVRARLVERYGKERVPPKGPIPAHLLGNMWAQEWGNLFPVLKPFEALPLDINGSLVKQKYDALKMARSAEAFYTSLGLAPLPDSFWKKSLFTKPKDREVVCHASAWDVDLPKSDLRIKMCIDPTEEDLVTIYHELGHIYYFLYYADLPYVFQSGAHDGFHEAIGDTLTLSMTPAFYRQIGLIDRYQEDERAVINQQLKLALDKIAFLPFGKLIDQWRWHVFSGKIPATEYNRSWWQLRTEYQGIAAPEPRDERYFDPGAKYHIPANTPYTRYFLAHILQFQFHRTLCQAAGHEGPLHQCSIYGSKEAGARLISLLKAGQRRPWQDTLQQFSGARQMDASALVDYFAPLSAWLEKQNQGRECGW